MKKMSRLSVIRLPNSPQDRPNPDVRVLVLQRAQHNIRRTIGRPHRRQNEQRRRRNGRLLVGLQQQFPGDGQNFGEQVLGQQHGALHQRRYRNVEHVADVVFDVLQNWRRILVLDRFVRLLRVLRRGLRVIVDDPVALRRRHAVLAMTRRRSLRRTLVRHFAARLARTFTTRGNLCRFGWVDETVGNDAELFAVDLGRGGA
jgi:hypothetical protein